MKALDKLTKKQKFHTIVKPNYQSRAVHKGKGRPKTNAVVELFEWQVTAEFELKQASVDTAIEQNGNQCKKIITFR